MTSIDERIKRELESDPSLITGAEPVSDMVLDAFKGRIGRYMVFAVLMAMALTAVFIWTVVELYTAETTKDAIIWGMWAVVSGFTVLFFELWSWMQINRVALKRDIKELELTIRMLGFRKDS